MAQRQRVQIRRLGVRISLALFAFSAACPSVAFLCSLLLAAQFSLSMPGDLLPVSLTGTIGPLGLMDKAHQTRHSIPPVPSARWRGAWQGSTNGAVDLFKGRSTLVADEKHIGSRLTWPNFSRLDMFTTCHGLALAILVEVWAHQLEPNAECFDRMDSTAWSCCDTENGPRGRKSCWDDFFTFDRCCRGFDFLFEVRHCCGSSWKCLDFPFRCVSGPNAKECWMHQSLLRFHFNATTCEGSSLYLPSYIAVQLPFSRGRELSLKGTILPSTMTKKPRILFRRFRDADDACVGNFLHHEHTYGTCIQSQHTLLRGKSPFRFSLPERDLDCASLCIPPRCKIYAAAFNVELKEHRGDSTRNLDENRLVLAVPSSCSDLDVALRILPQLVSQRSPFHSDLRVAEAQLYHFLPGDPCEHLGRPEAFPVVVKLVALLVLPRLWPAACPKHSNGDCNEKDLRPDALDLVNLLRVVAIWHSCCLHWDIIFPFKSFKESLKWLLWPADKLLDHTLQVKMMTCLEGLYVTITVFLVLQCDDWQMLSQRLLRKLGRQLVVMYFAASALPMLLYTSSPMNCVVRPEVAPSIVAQSATNFVFGGRDWNWAVQMDLRNFLLVGSIGLLRQRFPRTLPAVCALYWAYIVGLAAREGPCELGEVSLVPKQLLADRIEWVTHVSFWLHWFPTSLLLLNLDTCLRKPESIDFMGQIKQMLGYESLGGLIVAMLLLSYWISIQSREADWQNLGFSDCPNYLHQDGPSPSMPYVLVGLPFHLLVFASLHLAAAPEPGSSRANGQKANAAVLKPRQLSGVAALCNVFRNINLAFIIWHWNVKFFAEAHVPAWHSLLRVTQAKSTLKEQLLFFAPMALGTFTLAWLTYHGLEKPWARLLRDMSQSCPPTLLYLFFGVYFVMNNVVFWANGFQWTEKW
eukprot:s44_g28.t1